MHFHLRKRVKSILGLGLMVVLFFSMNIFVAADAGPKPSITIEGENIPGQVCYMDLLIESESSDLEAFDSWGDYDEAMLSLLQNYEDNGWRPALSAGAGDLLYGDIRCQVIDGKVYSNFSYIGVPDRFKVIVVTEDLDLVVSNIVEKKTFQSQVSFDFETGQAREKGVMSLVIQFFPAFILTLLVEFLVLLIFRFHVKQHWKVVLFVNLTTQILLHTVITWGVMVGGVFVALLFFFFMEWLIVIGESIAFAKLLKEHKTSRRVMFSIVANFLSFIAGLFVVLSMSL